jgi:hypothetical protein
MGDSHALMGLEVFARGMAQKELNIGSEYLRKFRYPIGFRAHHRGKSTLNFGNIECESFCSWGSV